MALHSGAMIADRYRLQRLIATGGMGQVWEGLDTRLDRRVAVKVLKAELSGDADFLTRFRFEARTTAQLNHPGIAAVHDYGETRNDPSVDGTSRLSAYLKWGTLHPRQLLDRLGGGAGEEVFRSEIAWREFYADVLYQRPETAREALSKRPLRGALPPTAAVTIFAAPP